jgi:hypothetical protein
MIMARKKNDGRGRMGGRAVGTPNKTTGAVKTAISQIVEEYISPSTGGKKRPTLIEDMKKMQPGERAKLISGLASYIVPKQQALTVEDQTRVEFDSLVEFLETAPESAINAIAEKVVELQTRNGGKQ